MVQISIRDLRANLSKSLRPQISTQMSGPLIYRNEITVPYSTATSTARTTVLLRYVLLCTS